MADKTNDRLKNVTPPVDAMNGVRIRFEPVENNPNAVVMTADAGTGEARTVAEFDSTGLMLLAASALSTAFSLPQPDDDPDNPDSD